MCARKKSWRKWLFIDLQEENRKQKKGSLADPETGMKLCGLLICSPAETGRTVTLIKQSTITSHRNILINCWKAGGLLLCFDSLFLRSCFSLALHLCTHEHIAIVGVGAIGNMLALPCRFVQMWMPPLSNNHISEELGSCGFVYQESQTVMWAINCWW